MARVLCDLDGLDISSLGNEVDDQSSSVPLPLHISNMSMESSETSDNIKGLR